VAGLSDRIKSASVAFVVGRGKVEEPVVVFYEKERKRNGLVINILTSVSFHLYSVDLAP
jgi:hypothetical protein